MSSDRSIQELLKESLLYGISSDQLYENTNQNDLHSCSIRQKNWNSMKVVHPKEKRNGKKMTRKERRIVLISTLQIFLPVLYFILLVYLSVFLFISIWIRYEI